MTFWQNVFLKSTSAEAERITCFCTIDPSKRNVSFVLSTVKSNYSFWYRITPLGSKEVHFLAQGQFSRVLFNCEGGLNHSATLLTTSTFRAQSGVQSQFSWFELSTVQFRSVGVCRGWLRKAIDNLMGSDKTLARVHSTTIRAHHYYRNMLLR